MFVSVRRAFFFAQFHWKCELIAGTAFPAMPTPPFLHFVNHLKVKAFFFGFQPPPPPPLALGGGGALEEGDDFLPPAPGHMAP